MLSEEEIRQRLLEANRRFNEIDTPGKYRENRLIGKREAFAEVLETDWFDVVSDNVSISENGGTDEGGSEKK